MLRTAQWQLPLRRRQPNAAPTQATRLFTSSRTRGVATPRHCSAATTAQQQQQATSSATAAQQSDEEQPRAAPSSAGAAVAWKRAGQHASLAVLGAASIVLLELQEAADLAVTGAMALLLTLVPPPPPEHATRGEDASPSSSTDAEDAKQQRKQEEQQSVVASAESLLQDVVLGSAGASVDEAQAGTTRSTQPKRAAGAALADRVQGWFTPSRWAAGMLLCLAGLAVPPLIALAPPVLAVVPFVLQLLAQLLAPCLLEVGNLLRSAVQQAWALASKVLVATGAMEAQAQQQTVLVVSGAAGGKAVKAGGLVGTAHTLAPFNPATALGAAPPPQPVTYTVVASSKTGEMILTATPVVAPAAPPPVLAPPPEGGPAAADGGAAAAQYWFWVAYAASWLLGPVLRVGIMRVAEALREWRRRRRRRRARRSSGGGGDADGGEAAESGALSSGSDAAEVEGRGQRRGRGLANVLRLCVAAVRLAGVLAVLWAVVERLVVPLGAVGGDVAAGGGDAALGVAKWAKGASEQQRAAVTGALLAQRVRHCVLEVGGVLACAVASALHMLGLLVRTQPS